MADMNIVEQSENSVDDMYQPQENGTNSSTIKDTFCDDQSKIEEWSKSKDFLKAYEENERVNKFQFEKIINENYDGSADRYLSAVKKKIKNSLIFTCLVDVDNDKINKKTDEELTELLKAPFDGLVYTRSYEILEFYQKICDYIRETINEKEYTMRHVMEKITIAGKASGRWNVKYRNMLQNNLINDFNRVVKLSDQNSIVDYDEKNKVCTFKKVQQNPNFIIKINNFQGKKLEIKTPVKKLLDMMIIEFTENDHNSDNPLIMFSVRNYASKCGLKNVTDARKQIEASLQLLSDISISYYDKKAYNNTDADTKDTLNGKIYENMKIIDHGLITDNNVVLVHFSDEFADMLVNNAYVMPYPMIILGTVSKKTAANPNKSHNKREEQKKIDSSEKTSPKSDKAHNKKDEDEITPSPNSYYIIHKMAEHKRINKGKKTQNVLSVKTLLKACPYNMPTLPPEMRSENKKDQFVESFTAELERVCKLLNIECDFRYAQGEKIPSKELIDMSYETLIDAYVRFDDWTGYPEANKNNKTKGRKNK